MRNVILGNISCEPYIPSHSQEYIIACKVRGNLAGYIEFAPQRSVEGFRGQDVPCPASDWRHGEVADEDKTPRLVICSQESCRLRNRRG